MSHFESVQVRVSVTTLEQVLPAVAERLGLEYRQNSKVRGYSGQTKVVSHALLTGGFYDVGFDVAEEAVTAWHHADSTTAGLLEQIRAAIAHEIAKETIDGARKSPGLQRANIRIAESVGVSLPG
jgi:hypothetical protein